MGIFSKSLIAIGYLLKLARKYQRVPQPMIPRLRLFSAPADQRAEVISQIAVEFLLLFRRLQQLTRQAFKLGRREPDAASEELLFLSASQLRLAQQLCEASNNRR